MHVREQEIKLNLKPFYKNQPSSIHEGKALMPNHCPKVSLHIGPALGTKLPTHAFRKTFKP
jgi:hypothetical protein